MSRLAGHHALVTGGGTGIGAAIARRLAAEGAKLTLVGRREKPLQETAEAIGGAIALADVTDRLQVEGAFTAARHANGPVTILVNNAGAAESAPFPKVGEDMWKRLLAVNLDALFHCCQAALPDLLQAEAGRIVTIASTASLKGYAYIAPYVAAKHGAVGLTRALAAEYARTGMTVNAVCPGFTDTDLVARAAAEITAKTGRDDEASRTELAKFNPQRRLIKPAEVAEAVLWLCLPESQAINGQAIAVAGGEVM
ncbi:SDR family NAD(P)-dependent oxidoreductase [Sphingosinicella rhizophila]|uniref:SDR family oxidoreductase n=1 Tax=Sphingosinicella rhizophila TaxID=3050082 RepID=A0ABU3Q4U2_9SPHN|nr:SDR family oxidoreductase [Sphingosinicella sp. GR2756]MDT9598332.1 SDR family oxidoreductase [Sphingosinicella sp. GR2756]